MTDLELAAELWASRADCSVKSARNDFIANPSYEAIWLAVARRARELLAAPALPAVVPEGCVRVRAAVAVGEEGKDWAIRGDARVHDVAIAREARNALGGNSAGACISFITVDAKKPEPPPEIVAVAEPAP